MKIGDDGMATIGIDASRANAGERTGAEWYAYHLIQAMKRVETPGLEFVLYSREPLRDGLEQLPQNWRARRLPWTHLPFWTQLGLSWELLRHPVDLLFEPTHSLPFVRPRRVVATLHDIGFERLPDVYSRAELRYHRHMARHAIRSASRIFTVSDFSRREIIEVYRADPHRVLVTPNAVDPEVYHESISEERKRAVLEQYRLSQPFFLFAGRLEAKKNIANILSGFALFRTALDHGERYRLVLIGKPGLGFDGIRAEITRLGLEAYLDLPGYVPEEDMPALMAAANALVFPSRYEGFGIPILQAQAVGTPVITSDRAAMPEVAGAGAILVKPEDPAAIAAALTNLVKDANLRTRLRAAGLENAKRYSWHDTARQTVKVMLDVLGRPVASARDVAETRFSRSGRS